ncbi:hypothetical protein ACFUV2_22845 [Streptomyces pilosus]|uniref:hypothetical protein n=1 Tax=Streptomyces pilosus TaxID=28893 RepID=UPI00363D5C20
MNPITVAELRADWHDAPDLSSEQKQVLGQLAETDLQEALDAAFRRHEDTYCRILDSTRSDATRALLERMAT